MNITVRVRLLDDKERVLLVLERGDKTVIAGVRSFVKPAGWGLPGGRTRAHKGETPYEAAVRELREETGITAEINPEPTFKNAAGEDHEIWMFEAKNPHGEPAAVDPEEHILTARWIDWKTVYDSFLYEGMSYPVYKSHLPLIHMTALAQ